MSPEAQSRPPTSPDQTEATHADDPAQMPPPDAFKAAASRFPEVAAYLRQYFSARFDLAKLKVRRIILYAALGIVGLIALTALITTLVVMLCTGLAGWIAAGLNGRVWAGNLIVSVGLIAIVVGGTWLALKLMDKRRLKQAIQRYEQRQRIQRDKFGHDAVGKSTQASKAAN
jgi:hypothetical protein